MRGVGILVVTAFVLVCTAETSLEDLDGAIAMEELTQKQARGRQELEDKQMTELAEFTEKLAARSVVVPGRALLAGSPVAPPTETPTMAPTLSPTERSTLEDMDPEVALEGLRVDMGFYVTKKEGENFIKQAQADLARANGLAVATLNAAVATAQQKANDQLTEWSLKLLTRENAETDASEKVLTGIVTQLETQAKVRIAKVKGPVVAAKVRYERSLAKMPVWESQALKMKTPNEIDDARRMQMIKSAIKTTEADAMQNGRGYSGAPVAREKGDNRREAEAMQNARAKSQKP